MAKQIIITLPDEAYDEADALCAMFNASGSNFEADEQCNGRVAAWCREWLVNTVAAKAIEKAENQARAKAADMAVDIKRRFRGPAA